MKVLRDAVAAFWLYGVAADEESCPNEMESPPTLGVDHDLAPSVVVQLATQQYRTIVEDDDARTLKVYRHSSSESCAVDVFELLEPVDLELGVGNQNQKHNVDFAYSPVVFRPERIEVHEVEETGPKWYDCRDIVCC